MKKLSKNKCYFENQHINNYEVKFALYNEQKYNDEEIYKEVMTLNNHACYSAFWRKVSKNSTHIYTILKQDVKKNRLSKTETMLWIKLCKRYDLLPKYVKNKDCYLKDKDGLIRFRLKLNITKKPQARIYLYLDSFRHLREDPGFIKAIIYLHRDCGINFYAAYILSSHLNIVGTGHHALKVDNTVYSSVNKPNINKDKITNLDSEMNLKMVRSFYKYIHEKKKYNGKDKKIGVDAKTWDCNTKIAKLTDIDLVIRLKYLKDERVISIIEEKDCKKAKQLYNKFMKEIT